MCRRCGMAFCLVLWIVFYYDAYVLIRQRSLRELSRAGVTVILLIASASPILAKVSDTLLTKYVPALDDLRSQSQFWRPPELASLTNSPTKSVFDAIAARYQTEAANGLPMGQLKLAVLYETGIGVTKDPVEAVRLCRLAAKQGLPTRTAKAQRQTMLKRTVGTGARRKWDLNQPYTTWLSLVYGVVEWRLILPRRSVGCSRELKKTTRLFK